MSRPAKKIADSSAYPPRGMRSDRAAAYLGMSEASFLRLVEEKVLSPGIPIKGMRIWDRVDLDNDLENLKTRRRNPRNSMDEILGVNDDDDETEGK